MNVNSRTFISVRCRYKVGQIKLYHIPWPVSAICTFLILEPTWHRPYSAPPTGRSAVSVGSEPSKIKDVPAFQIASTAISVTDFPLEPADFE